MPLLAVKDDERNVPKVRRRDVARITLRQKLFGGKEAKKSQEGRKTSNGWKVRDFFYVFSLAFPSPEKNMSIKEGK